MTFPEDCKGLLAKGRIVEKYNVQVLSRWKVLNRRIPIQGCCGQLEDEAYSFEYIDKTNAKVNGVFHVGYHCAEQFLGILKQPKPPLISLLGAAPQEGPSELDVADSKDGRSRRPAMNLLNWEVELAINILLQAWASEPKPPLRDTLKAIRERPHVAISDSRVRSLNTIVGNDKKKRKLIQMLEEMRPDNPSIARLSFPRISEILNNSIKKDWIKVNNIE